MVATASSQWSPKTPASKAIDSFIGLTGKQMFRSAEGDSYPWLQVDFGRPDVIVHELLVHLRPKTSQRFHDVEVRVGDDEWTDTGKKITVNTVCACANETLESGVAATKIMCEEPLRGRFLSMQVLRPAGRNTFLEVNEIDFYGAFAQSKRGAFNVLIFVTIFPSFMS